MKRRKNRGRRAGTHYYYNRLIMNKNQKGENLEESQEPTFGFPFGIPLLETIVSLVSAENIPDSIVTLDSIVSAPHPPQVVVSKKQRALDS